MFQAILLILSGIGLIVASKKVSKLQEENKKIPKAIAFFAGIGLILTSIATTSIIYIEKDHSGHMYAIYGSNSLKDGKIIATNGETGWQAEVLSPGFKFIPLVNIYYDVEEVEDLIVNKGEIAILKAQDGRTMQDTVIAPSWENMYEIDGNGNPTDKKVDINKMINNAKYFLDNGGLKGTQLNVLLPGQYRINRKLWDVTIKTMTVIPEGKVGVVIALTGKEPDKTHFNSTEKSLSVPIVNEGEKGIQKKYLVSGKYPINPFAAKVVEVPTTTETFRLAGGYKSSKIDFNLDKENNIVPERSPVDVPTEAGAEGDAVDIKSKDGWTINQNLSIQLQIEPHNAPMVVASVGSYEKLKNLILSLTDSTLTNIAMTKDAMELKDQKAETQAMVEKEIKELSRKYGGTIQGVKLGTIDLPAELLQPLKYKQFAESMKIAFEEQEKANKELIKANRAKAEADQQSNLVEAEIDLQKATKEADAAKIRAQGEKDKLIIEGQGQKANLISIAEGMSEQAKVIGKEGTTKIKMLEIYVKGQIDSGGKLTQMPQNLTIVGQGAEGGVGSDLLGAAALMSGNALVKPIIDKSPKGK